jgi:enediyne polyketide synthase
MPEIAIIGMACRYPDARSPVELWENALAQRRAFRRMPEERLRLADYFSADANAPDRTYSQMAAVIEGYEFDRVRFRVSGSTFRSVDLTHWLALDMAAQALVDAGYPDARDLPREATGVFVGNTLTGEFARANMMRLRWPYVRRVVDSSLAEEGWSESDRERFMAGLEEQYKSAFPPVAEETLAGGISNTIAGRICNYFDLKGGGYTVDAACASSLLSVANACAALEAGDLEVALAGGVDLSLDPFELVGFAKVGALAREKMRVFDERSAGFWPGEGCGMAVLMRMDDALRRNQRIYAAIRGWGVSSDGSGGITRPEKEGQLLAVRRAYRRAGFGIESVAYFEAHGTGTAVGDSTELAVILHARQEAARKGPPAVLSTIKANIGHTKAAAGVAGLIKAAMALYKGVLPPISGCDHPDPQLNESRQTALRILRRGEGWSQDRPARAGVSAMGFGGINTHVVLEGPSSARPSKRTIPPPAQDAELFLFAADDREGLLACLEQVATFAAKLSEAELTDLAAELERRLGSGDWRAAVVAGQPQELEARLKLLAQYVHYESACKLEVTNGAFFAKMGTAPRIGFLLPGQGSPVSLQGGLWRDRFECLDDLYDGLKFAATVDTRATEIAQPAVVRATLSGLRLLDRLGIQATVSIGHSLGELTALHWAGALDEQSVLRIASIRGEAMSSLNGPTGVMASINANYARVAELLNGCGVVIAGLNSPSQTVISGEAAAVASVVRRARAAGLKTASLPVSHAFHSPLIAGAAPILADCLERERFEPLRRTVVSTVTGRPLADENLCDLLCSQMKLPVRFQEALEAARASVDLWIEAGPGTVLSGLASEIVQAPVIAIDAGSSSLAGLLSAAAAAFVLGAPVRHQFLFEGRIIRPFQLDWRPRFFSSPCESAPVRDVEISVQRRLESEAPPQRCANDSAVGVLRELVAHRAELPLADVKESLRLLTDLHLNSIIVGQIVAAASHRLGIPAPIAPTQYADARISEMAQALEEIAQCGVDQPRPGLERAPPGVGPWLRCFRVDFVEKPLMPPGASRVSEAWRVFGNERIEVFRSAFARAPGDGVAVVLPADPDPHQARFLLAAGQEALKSGEGSRFVVVEQGGGGGAFARTLHLEAPDITCCVVSVPVEHAHSPQWAVAEAVSANGYVEAHYDRAGVRRAAVLKLLRRDDAPASKDRLTADDVLLVTGGGKGIAAECALGLARATGVRLALMGRSNPDSDPDLTANLKRLYAAGVAFRYYSGDVSDAESVRRCVQQAEAELGPVTAVMHAAGVNVPRLIGALDAEALDRTLLPKLAGLENLLSALDPHRLRLLVTFGSLIARTGLPGEADYGLANEWLRVIVERWRDQHPSCRCLHVDWSVWAANGMGERLGRMDLLTQYGIMPIRVEDGVGMLCELVQRDLPETSIVVAGRLGDPPTLARDTVELPFLRFLEKVRAYTRGVELLVEAELSIDSDPYLGDHVFSGERIMPGVLGLEAMAQVATSLLETDTPPCFEDVIFDRPVVVREGKPVVIRIAALITRPGYCRVVLRSSETAFAVDHFRATCTCGERQFEQAEWTNAPKEHLPLDPSRDLYGRILFHSGRFRRLAGYHHLRARTCIAEIRAADTENWFWKYLPPELMLGDPGARDAAIHAIQACIPQTTLLPTGVDRIVTSRLPASAALCVRAQERDRVDNAFIYDVDIVDADGRVIEQWRGLRLQPVGKAQAAGGLAAPLLGPYLERRVQEAIPCWRAAIVVDESEESELAMRRAIGSKETILRRADGKPEIAGGAWSVSATHCGALLLAVGGCDPVCCDAEEVIGRTQRVWRDLLGSERYAIAEWIAAEQKADFDAAATIVWTASECLTKAGAPPDSPLLLEPCAAEDMLLFSSGAWRIASLEIPSATVPRVFSFLCGVEQTTCAAMNTGTS